ncbi:RNA-guided pseudouridylation complex pseudouridine synthase subunit Cbf5 [Candidatus Woesearchaeota archaeon]|nr:RNA-guided pseudouridylation complex pseudouridine synthase subunit Cbf5 [Candidatus Woesearchaeota archaeon]
MDELPFEKLKKKVLIKKDSIGSYGSRPEKRKTEDLLNYGIVNIDKPRGPTSHQVSDYVKSILGISKAGHSGTLDPHVTGVLPVALGRATRIVQALLPAGKEYITLMHIHKPLSEERIKKAMGQFKGKIMQKPPIKSAVRRVERARKIYYIDIMEIDGQDILFKVGCQAGTYIRKLCHDIGIKLGCGAHMAELRRTKAASFDESTAFMMQDLTDAFYYYKEENNDKFLRKVIQPMENAVSHLPKVWVLDSSIGPLSHGRDLAIPGISRLCSGIKKDDTVAVMTLKDELIALGASMMGSKEIMDKAKGIAVRTDKVFIS